MNGPEIEFDWDEANIGHLARHKVLPEEAEQVSSTIRWTLEWRSSKVRSAISTLARQLKAAYFWW